MNTKNIFKTLALAMLMPAMLLTSACSNEDDVANTSNITNKGYALPVTVNVTRQDGATRASFDGSKLNFSDGDKLFVRGNYNSGNKFAGTLTWQSGGTFSGTIYTQNEWENSADALFSSAESIYATLLPAGYDSYNFLSIDNNGTTEVAYDDRESISKANAFVASATAKATGVEQLSWERAGSYSDGFALAPRYAVLNFTISGLTAGAKDVTLKVTDGNDYSVTGSVTPNASGVATFAVGVLDYTNIQDVANNLTVGTANFTLPSNIDFTAGKIYNINRSAAPAPSYTMAAAATTSDKGKLICTAGHIHVYGEDAACTAGRVAKIIYVGTNGHATYNHGLALALEDMSTKLTWDNSGANNDGKTAAEWCSAWNTSKPVTDAEWLLASKDQWDYMLGTSGAGSYTDLRDGFTSVGGTNMKTGNYWSSTENGTDNAWNCNFSNFGHGEWYSSYKNYNGYNVRACLAF